MNLHLFATLYSLSLLALSAYFYQHRRKTYSENKKVGMISTARCPFVYRYFQVSTVVYITMSYFFLDWRWGVIFNSRVGVWVGLSIATLGVLLFIVARLELNSSPISYLDSYIPSSIVHHGVYRYIRHPLYTANIVFLLGLFLAIGQILLLINAAILTVYYYQAAVQEERSLRARFSEYPQYEQTTGMFLPPLRKPPKCPKDSDGNSNRRASS